MAIASIIIGLIFLVLAAFFLLGWIWPLAVGIIKKRRGEKGTVWLALGSVWCAGSVVVSALLGLAVYMYVSMVSGLETEQFDAASYDGATAALVVPYKDESSLTADTADLGNLSFKSSDGTFTVPAGGLTPTSYSITMKDSTGGDWHASWWFYSQTVKAFDLQDGSETVFDVGPPFTMKVKRKGLSGGMQRLNVQIFDKAGAEVTIRARQRPAVQIVNETGEVVWSKTLEYG